MNLIANRPPQYGLDWAFFLDVDGTLLDISEHPEAVIVNAALFDVLKALETRTSGALALVSGRAITNLDSLFSPLRLPCAGLHGAELRDPSGQVRQPEPAESNDLRRTTSKLQAFTRCHPGLLVEDKGLSVALHYRGAPQLEATCEKFVNAVMEELEAGHQLQKGKMVFEIRPKGKDKGTAIGEFMQAKPFRGKQPIFIGDDTTDEDGFRVVNTLGGHSIKVGDGETCAAWRLKDPPAVLEWLGQYLASMNEQGETPAF